MPLSCKDGLRIAIKTVGGARALGRLLGLTHQSIKAWDKIPAERMLAIERMTGIPRSVLRPDLYKTPSKITKKKKGADRVSTPQRVKRRS
jgi:DNA-binding transcriptional regulator YdaS (Cro superfamily)